MGPAALVDFCLGLPCSVVQSDFQFQEGASRCSLKCCFLSFFDYRLSLCVVWFACVCLCSSGRMKKALTKIFSTKKIRLVVFARKVCKYTRASVGHNKQWFQLTVAKDDCYRSCHMQAPSKGHTFLWYKYDPFKLVELVDEVLLKLSRLSV